MNELLTRVPRRPSRNDLDYAEINSLHPAVRGVLLLPLLVEASSEGLHERPKAGATHRVTDQQRMVAINQENVPYVRVPVLPEVRLTPRTRTVESDDDCGWLVLVRAGDPLGRGLAGPLGHSLVFDARRNRRALVAVLA